MEKKEHTHSECYGACSVSQYGQTNISGDIPARRVVYEGLIKYYDDPVMTKVHSPDHRYSMYACRINDLSHQLKYIYAVVYASQDPLGTKRRLSSLSWMSFQTRIVGKDHFLSGVNYSGTDSPFTEADMYQIQSPPNTTRYKVEGYPVTIDMLADGYRAKGVVKLSLETFNTIVYFS